MVKTKKRVKKRVRTHKRTVKVRRAKRVQRKAVRKIKPITTRKKGKRSFHQKPSKKLRKSTKKLGRRKVVDSYTITADSVTVTVNIIEDSGKKEYNIRMPEFSVVTKALLDDIRNVIVREVIVSSTDVLEPSAVEGLKKKFREKAEQYIEDKVPYIKPTTKHLLVGRLMQEMLGLDRIEFLLSDAHLEEIVIVNVYEMIRVYHKKHGWIETNIKPKSEDEIINFANIIARRVGRQITTLNPLLDAHLITGDRANAILYPISAKGNTITIRKFRRDPWTITDLIKNGSCSVEIFSVLWLAIEYEMNVLFSGGTASGKTTFLNVCMPFIPTNHRIVSIEDTRELLLPKTLYWAPLVTRQPNPEGKGEVTMLDLMINSLRMRPDRIIVGEIRRQREAEVLFEAMHTGHSVYATVHADSAAETISRLTHPPINIPPNLLRSVHLNVVLFRDRKKGTRRVLQVAEFIADEEKVTPNILFRYKPTIDKVIPHSKSLQFYDDIGRYTGMSTLDIEINLTERKKVLFWMVKNEIRSIEEISRIMNLYYSDKAKLMTYVNSNRKFSFHEQKKD